MKTLGKPLLDEPLLDGEMFDGGERSKPTVRVTGILKGMETGANGSPPWFGMLG